MHPWHELGGALGEHLRRKIRGKMAAYWATQIFEELDAIALPSPPGLSIGHTEHSAGRNTLIAIPN
jgi:hypothetical protein